MSFCKICILCAIFFLLLHCCISYYIPGHSFLCVILTHPLFSKTININRKEAHSAFLLRFHSIRFDPYFQILALVLVFESELLKPNDLLINNARMHSNRIVQIGYKTNMEAKVSLVHCWKRFDLLQIILEFEGHLIIPQVFFIRIFKLFKKVLLMDGLNKVFSKKN